MLWYTMVDFSDSDSDTNYYDDDNDDDDDKNYHDDLICMYIFEKRSLVDIQKNWDQYYVCVRPINYISKVRFQI